MKILRIPFVLLILTTFINGCYPITQQLSLANNTGDINYQIDYKNDNFYQLRIQTKRDYLRINNEKDSSKSLVSDFPFKKFQQTTTVQEKINIDNNFIVEETYIYLDKNTENQFSGFAFYFITYPVIERNPNKPKSFAKRFFNDPTKLYTNIIRSVQVGYWIKDRENNIMLVFKNSEKQTMVLSGRVVYKDNKDEKKGLFIKKISHPLETNKQILNPEYFSKISKYSKLESAKKTTYNNSNQSINIDTDNTFRSLKNTIAFIDLNDVLGFEDNIEELYFLNVPKYKRFVLELGSKSNSKVQKNKQMFYVNGFKLDENNFYIKFEDNSTYLFNPKHVHFLKSLK